MKLVTATWIDSKAREMEITTVVVPYKNEHAIMLYAGDGNKLCRLIAVCGMEVAYEDALAPVEQKVTFIPLLKRDLQKLRWSEDDCGITIW